MGGPQIRIALVAAALSDRIDTTVVLPKRDNPAFIKFLRKHRVPFTVLPLNRMSRGLREFLRYSSGWPYEVLRLALLFRRNRPDVVHANGSRQFKALIAGKLVGMRVIWHLNDTEVPKFMHVVFRVLHRLADGYIFASYRSRTYYSRLIEFDRPAYVIPAPVDTRWYRPAYSESVAASEDGHLVIGMVGNVNPDKGIDTFIEAAATVQAKHPNATFRIVGHCYETQIPHMDKLKQRQTELGLDHVTFTGACDDPRVELAKFDVYVCASRHESSPLSVWEAMSMALPIVSTDVGDVPAFAPDGEVARIVPVGDSAAIAQAVGELLDDPQARQRMGTAARAAAERHLDLRRCAQLHAQAYAAVAGRAAPVPAEADAAAGGEGRST